MSGINYDLWSGLASVLLASVLLASVLLASSLQMAVEHKRLPKEKYHAGTDIRDTGSI
jgi:hypothetical protein